MQHDNKKSDGLHLRLPVKASPGNAYRNPSVHPVASEIVQIPRAATIELAPTHLRLVVDDVHGAAFRWLLVHDRGCRRGLGQGNEVARLDTHKNHGQQQRTMHDRTSSTSPVIRARILRTSPQGEGRSKQQRQNPFLNNQAPTAVAATAASLLTTTKTLTCLVMMACLSSEEDLR